MHPKQEGALDKAACKPKKDGERLWPVAIAAENISLNILACVDLAQDEPITAQQLKTLIKAAQAMDQKAIDALCAIFKPLVYKEARRLSVYNVLGEDAINIAWVIFLEVVHKYDRNSFLMFPGYVRVKLHYGLIDALHQRGCLLDCAALDASEEFADTVADSKNHIDERLNDLSFSSVLSKLTEKQRAIVEAIDLEEMTVQECSRLHKCSVQNIYKVHLSALKKLKKDLE